MTCKKHLRTFFERTNGNAVRLCDGSMRMALQDRKLHCLLHEFLSSAVITNSFWGRDQRDHCDWAGR